MHYRYQENLPIYEKRSEIVNAISDNQVIIIAGETGSGKTTQLPLFCLEAGRGSDKKIICTQPRRIAAISLATYVASCFDTPYQHEIGYKVRFRESVTSKTKVKFVTDGIILGEIVNDPLLEAYDTIIIDEAHERSINIDFLLGYLRTLLPKRPDLKLIISSATIDTKLFSRCFNHAPVITVSGRLFTVDFTYNPVIELWKGESMDSYLEGAATTVKEILEKEHDGDMLVFLPTIQDIIDLCNRLKYIVNDSAELIPLHSRLPVTQQQRVFRKYKKRKIVVATNIAETSITVPGIRFVIDSGLVRISRYDSAAHLTRMPIERISKASADQRAGRCGRVENGICYRLYSESDYMSRPSYTTPEIQRANLAGVILKMANIGLGDPIHFAFLQRPSNQALRNGYRQLYEMGAIDKKNRLTPLGRKMALFPLDPPVARTLIYASEHDSVRELMIIAAALSVDGSIVSNKENNSKVKSLFRHPDSDFMTILNVWFKYHNILRRQQTNGTSVALFCKENNMSPLHMKEWRDAFSQIRRICRNIRGFVHKRSGRASYDEIHKSIISGFYYGLAKRSESNMYSGIHIDNIRIFPSSVLFSKNPQWILFHEIVETNQVYGRIAAVIRPEWVENLFKKRCRYTYEDPWYDSECGVVKVREEVSFEGLLLIKNRCIDLERKDPERAHEIFVSDALVNEQIGNRFRFIKHNRELRDTISKLQHKLRRNLYLGDWVLENFYDERLAGVKNCRELNCSIKKHGSDSFLMMNLEDMLAVQELPSLDQYPDEISVGPCKCSISYLFSPGSPDDGVTLNVSDTLFHSVPGYYWEWLLPFQWRGKVEQIVSQIDKQIGELSLEKEMLIEKICSKLSYATGPFIGAVCALVFELTGIMVSASDISIERMSHCDWAQMVVTNQKGFVVFKSRLPFQKNKLVDNSGKRNEFWTELCKLYEQPKFHSWDTPFLEMIEISDNKQIVGLAGYPALHKEGGETSVRIFFSFSAASQSHAMALEHLLEKGAEEHFAWEFEEMKIPQQLFFKSKVAGVADHLEEKVKELILKDVLRLPEKLPVTEVEFKLVLQNVVTGFKQSQAFVINLLERIFAEYEKCSQLLQKKNNKYAHSYLKATAEELQRDLKRYILQLESDQTPITYLQQLPKYLNFFKRRTEVAYLDPGKYRSRMNIMNFYNRCLEQMIEKEQYLSHQVQREVIQMRILLEEFIICQLTAQNTKNSMMITDYTIQEKLEDLRYLIKNEMLNQKGVFEMKDI